MNFVIPMAGRGQRFLDAGFKTPKMLVEAYGKTLLEWSVDSLPLGLCTKLIFIGLSEHKDHWKVDELIELKYGDKYNVCQIYIDEPTRGQSETVLLSEELLEPENPLLIFNIDTAFKSSGISKNLLRKDIDGVLGTFVADSPKYSFAKIDHNNYVTEVAEKVVISNNALTGLYHFNKASDFIYSAKDAIKNSEFVKNEFYIAPLYNKLIAKGKKFILDSVDEYNVLGTPEELKLFVDGKRKNG